jgi:hypothetical protein
VGEVGLDHDSKNQYESRVVHRNLAFLRWQTAGIRVGHAQVTASAEMTFVNCVFWYNYAGVQLLAWNDYDNHFSGCHFQDNMGYGIEVQAGNMYVTNSRFERSGSADASLVEHTSSFRRCVSIGSSKFLSGGGTRPTKVQNVYVAGWGNATNASQPVTAISYGGSGPLQLYDAVFDTPLSPTSPIVHVGSYPFGGTFSPIIRANVTVLGCPACPFIQPFDPYPVNNVTVVDLPPGDPAIFTAIPKLGADTHFFTSSWPSPGTVFDAVHDFNASSSARWESSGAIQACINAAAAAGARAMCYLPAGVYEVNRTLSLCGAKPFSLTGGGAGFTTILRWGPTPPPPNTTVAVLAAGPGAGCAQGSNVAVEKINAFTSSWTREVIDFVVSRTVAVPASPMGRHGAFTLPPPFLPLPVHAAAAAAAANSRIVFDSFFFQSRGGAVLHALVDGDVVYGPLWDGNLEVLDSATAVVLGNFYAIEADGFVVARMDAASPLPPTTAGPGFLGFVTMVASSNEYDVWVYNSSSVAAGDFYSEGAQPLVSRARPRFPIHPHPRICNLQPRHPTPASTPRAMRCPRPGSWRSTSPSSI